nr:MAG TPA: hypothetical protein [Caudoviricetes sp.]
MIQFISSFQSLFLSFSHPYIFIKPSDCNHS